MKFLFQKPSNFSLPHSFCNPIGDAQTGNTCLYILLNDEDRYFSKGQDEITCSGKSYTLTCPVMAVDPASGDRPDDSDIESVW